MKLYILTQAEIYSSDEENKIYEFKILSISFNPYDELSFNQKVFEFEISSFDNSLFVVILHLKLFDYCYGENLIGNTIDSIYPSLQEAQSKKEIILTKEYQEKNGYGIEYHDSCVSVQGIEIVKFDMNDKNFYSYSLNY